MNGLPVNCNTCLLLAGTPDIKVSLHTGNRHHIFSYFCLVFNSFIVIIKQKILDLFTYSVCLAHKNLQCLEVFIAVLRVYHSI